MLSKAILTQLQFALDAQNDDTTRYEDVANMYKEAVTSLFAALKEDWIYDAVIKLLDTPRKEVEPNKRFYFSPETYSTTGLYHLLEKRYDAVQIEQVDIDEKYQQRIKLYANEIPGLLAVLLTWHLAKVKEELEYESAHPQTSGDDSLGSLDDHPF